MGWHTVTTRFEVVKFYGEKNLPCPGCGKKTRRRRTFEATINPWNVNGMGEPKTRREVSEDLRKEAAGWKQVPERHNACEETS
jgi:uncharacterized C2H2 Zn-finger protein